MNRLLLLLVLCLPTSLFGQGAYYQSNVMTSATNVPYGAQAPLYTVPYSTVTVCTFPANGAPCTNTVQVYSDQALTVPLDSPIETDPEGRFGFWATPGQYTYSVVSPAGKWMGNFTITVSAATGGGGGGSPAGNLNEVNSKLNDTTFQGSGIYNDVAKTVVSTASPNFAHYSHNPPRIGGPCAPAATSGCANTEFFAQDVATTNGANQSTGWGNAVNHYTQAMFTGRGIFNGYPTGVTYQSGGGTVIKGSQEDTIFHTPSISQAHGSTTWCGKPYDCAWGYHYFHYHGGQWGASDEAGTMFKTGGGNSYQFQGGLVVSGSPGQGATSITSSTIYNGNDILVSGYFYNANTSPLATGNVTNYDAANHLLTVTTATGTVTPPTTAGTTTAAITTTQNDANGFTYAVPVHLTSGAGFTISQTSPVIFACDNLRLEFVVPTSITAPDGSGNTTITGTFSYGHPTGCRVVQGGTYGILDLTADRLGASWKTSYFVYDATDATHIHEVTYLRGTKGFINDSRHNFGGGKSHLTSAIVTRTSNVVKVCNLGQGEYNFGGQYVQLSGFSPSDFNGTYTASQLDANYCFTVASTGSDGTATGGAVDVGGAVNSPDGTTLGGGGYNIWETAMLKQIGTTTTTTNGTSINSYNNTFTFYPNNMHFASGNTLLSLDDMQSKLDMVGVAGIMDTPPNQYFDTWLGASVAGYGVTSTQFRVGLFANTNAWTMYQGGGSTGTMTGPTLLTLGGPSYYGIDMAAPLPLGKAIHINTNPMMTSGVGNQTYFPFFVDGIGGGGGGFVIQYNPATGTTGISSGTGNGTSSGITMTPTTFTFGSTGLFTFAGSGFKFNTLAGSGTRPLLVDSTGTLVPSAAGVTVSGTSCTVKAIVNGIITSATCP